MPIFTCDSTVTAAARRAYASACYAGSAMGIDAVAAFLADGNAGEAIHYLTDEHMAALAVRTPQQAVKFCRLLLADALRAERLAEVYADRD